MKSNLRKVNKRPGKGTILSLVVAVPLAVAAGYMAPGVTESVTLGQAASSLATDLGCTDYKPEKTHSSLYTHHEAGSCKFDAATVLLVTFDHRADADAFAQTVRVVESNNANLRSAALAVNSGWAVASAPNYDLSVAEAVVAKMGGHVVSIPSTVKPETTQAPKATPKVAPTAAPKK